MFNEEYLYYTYMHRKAFVFTVNKVVKDEVDKEELLRRARFHDVDKMLLYTLIPKEDASNYHRVHSTHHLDNGVSKCGYDFMEMIIDFECAGYTKPDKPLNAYDTVQRDVTHNKNVLIPIMRSWDIASSYQNTPNDAEWLEYVRTIEQPTEKHYLNEIYQWIIQDPYTATLALQYAEVVHLNQERHNSYYSGYYY